MRHLNDFRFLSLENSKSKAGMIGKEMLLTVNGGGSSWTTENAQPGHKP